MQAVLISIQPKWVEKILNGEKTVEVRKSKPKLEAPFKCYIYCTKSGGYYKHIYVNEKDARNKYGVADHWSKKQQIVEVNGSKSDPNNFLAYECYLAEGKAVAGFICDNIRKIECDSEQHELNCKDSCLSLDDFISYCNGKDLFAWHISDLVIYDKPKELGEFYKRCDWVCGDCEYYAEDDCKSGFEHYKPLKHPPQSWCYVEGMEEL